MSFCSSYSYSSPTLTRAIYDSEGGSSNNVHHLVIFLFVSEQTPEHTGKNPSPASTLTRGVYDTLHELAPLLGCVQLRNSLLGEMSLNVSGEVSGALNILKRRTITEEAVADRNDLAQWGKVEGLKRGASFEEEVGDKCDLT